MAFRYLFGPIPSRRLGISLGVDLVPHKVCNLNCIYCESGNTSVHTNKRDDYIPYKEILKELETYLAGKPKLDYITFSGAGEPTLHMGIGQILNYIKSHFPQYKTCLITNGLLFSKEEVRNELREIDLILPSLDAATQAIFMQINRPVKGVEIKDVAEGLYLFNKSFKGEMWLELFIVPGVNDTQDELSLLKEYFTRIKPTKVQLNTLDRPGSVEKLKAATYEELLKIQTFLFPVKTEIIYRQHISGKVDVLQKDYKSLVVKLVARRPCSLEDLSQVLSLDTSEAEEVIRQLLEEKKIEKEKQGRLEFYKLPSH
jgi:wyosine [tRNA(Phe)-imidazoG37] synthetase (radical SAM superfamily)